MARTTFSRTVVITHCEGEYVNENEDIIPFKINLYGDYDINTVQNAAKRKLKTKGLIVQKISHESFYGSMNIEEFAKHCEKSNRKEW